MWMMPLHLHVNQKSDYDDMTETNLTIIEQGNIRIIPAMFGQNPASILDVKLKQLLTDIQ